jgi:hypothetical protein
MCSYLEWIFGLEWTGNFGLDWNFWIGLELLDWIGTFGLDFIATNFKLFSINFILISPFS